MPYGITKSWKRILADRRVGLILARKGRKQTRVFFWRDRITYEIFVRETKSGPLVEEIGDDARFKLLWIGLKDNCQYSGIFS